MRTVRDAEMGRRSLQVFKENLISPLLVLILRSLVEGKMIVVSRHGSVKAETIMSYIGTAHTPGDICISSLSATFN